MRASKVSTKNHDHIITTLQEIFLFQWLLDHHLSSDMFSRLAVYVAGRLTCICCF